MVALCGPGGADGVGMVLFIVALGFANLPYLCIALLGLIFPIVGAVKANKGVHWRYPLTIPFIR
jgi:uncharacterized Tic20 family protein